MVDKSKYFIHGRKGQLQVMGGMATAWWPQSKIALSAPMPMAWVIAHCQVYKFVADFIYRYRREKSMGQPPL